MSLFPRRRSTSAEVAALIAAQVGGVGPDDHVKAVIAVANATGGATTALLTLDLFRADGVTRIASVRQVLIRFTSTLYSGSADSSPTLGTVTAGTLVASLSGLFLVETDASGNFDCTVTNATDETLYAVAMSADNGVSDAGRGCIVLACVPDAVAWSA